jgi:hypothetical protein
MLYPRVCPKGEGLMGISIQIYHYFNVKQMKFSDYENAFSFPRLNRYLRAYQGKKNKALTAYRYNLKLSKEFFCFSSNHINASYSEEMYQLILKYISWLGFNSDELLFGIDGTEKLINKLKML